MVVPKTTCLVTKVGGGTGRGRIAHIVSDINGRRALLQAEVSGCGGSAGRLNRGYKERVSIDIATTICSQSAVPATTAATALNEAVAKGGDTASDVDNRGANGVGQTGGRVVPHDRIDDTGGAIGFVMHRATTCPPTVTREACVDNGGAAFNVIHSSTQTTRIVTRKARIGNAGACITVVIHPSAVISSMVASEIGIDQRRATAVFIVHSATIKLSRISGESGVGDSRTTIVVIPHSTAIKSGHDFWQKVALATALGY